MTNHTQSNLRTLKSRNQRELRTVTYDAATHKICPIECTDDQAEAIAKVVNVCGGIAESIYHSAIAAATEYQDTCTDGGKCGAGGYCKDCIQEPTKDE